LIEPCIANSSQGAIAAKSLTTIRAAGSLLTHQVTRAGFAPPQLPAQAAERVHADSGEPCGLVHAAALKDGFARCIEITALSQRSTELLGWFSHDLPPNSHSRAGSVAGARWWPQRPWDFTGAEPLRPKSNQRRNLRGLTDSRSSSPCPASLRRDRRCWSASSLTLVRLGHDCSGPSPAANCVSQRQRNLDQWRKWRTRTGFLETRVAWIKRSRHRNPPRRGNRHEGHCRCVTTAWQRRGAATFPKWGRSDQIAFSWLCLPQRLSLSADGEGEDRELCLGAVVSITVAVPRHSLLGRGSPSTGRLVNSRRDHKPAESNPLGDADRSFRRPA
jgi:hypothetical protein